MQSRWSDPESREYIDRLAPTWGEDMALRVYTSRLIGRDPDLVMHGGGNTSLKGAVTTLVGDKVEALFVKGSGWDLDAIEPPGLPAVDLAHLRRLRQLLFGSRTEKTEAVVGPKDGTPETAMPPDAAVGAESTAGEGTTDVSGAAADSKGHGRNGAAAYRGAERIDVPHPSLRAGDACPACGEGTVYDKAPGVLVRITGQPPLAAKTYRLQKLRCHLCGQVFTADAPAEAGPTKYDAAAGSMIGLLKYGSGLPNKHGRHHARPIIRSPR